MEEAFSDRDLNRMSQRSLNFSGGYISSHCSILNSPKLLEHIWQTDKLDSVLCHLESDLMKEKEDKKKRSIEAEENRRRKPEEKQVM